MPYKDKQKQKEYQSRWVCAKYTKARDAWIALNGPCQRCQSWDQLEIDHIDAKTKVSRIRWTLPEEQRLVELAKCQVLCNKCHIAKGIESGDYGQAEHGREQMYKRHRCRCEECRAWKRASYQRWG